MIQCYHHSGKHIHHQNNIWKIQTLTLQTFANMSNGQPDSRTEQKHTHTHFCWSAAMNICFFLAAAVCCSCNANCIEGSRPEVAQILLERLFHGDDPMSIFKAERFTDTESSILTRLSLKDVRLVLDAAEKPINFWLELGSFEGHSAIFASRGLLKYGLHASVVSVDTFLGDTFTLWHGRLKTQNRSEGRRRSWLNDLRPDGSITIFDRFKSHVRHNGMQSCILPIPATTIVGLKLVESLAKEQLIPRPQVIYLDSAHEEGEVLLELRKAWHRKHRRLHSRL